MTFEWDSQAATLDSEPRIKMLLHLFGMPIPVNGCKIPNQPGIYFITRRTDGIIAYIGHSQTLARRLKGHHIYDKEKHNVYICLTPIGSIQHALLENIEAALIGLALPLYNLQWKPLTKGWKRSDEIQP